MAGRLRESLTVLQRLGVRVPRQCRARAALAFLDALNKPGAASPAVGDEAFERAIEAHDRTARELFTITYMAWEERRRPDSPFTVKKLETCLYGGDVDDGRDAEPRNTQFELNVAALLRLGGAGVTQGEPDLRADVTGRIVGLAAKRVRSLRDDTLDDRVEEAADQITRSGLTGYIALSVENRFRDVDPRQAEPELLKDFARVFDSVRYRWAAKYPRVLGAFLFGYATTITPAKGDALPLLSIVTPVRGERWAFDAEEASRFQEYFAMWHERMMRNVTFLMSPELGNRPL